MREAVEAVDAWLDGMPPKVRRAFLLRRIDGLKYAEIAAVMAVSEASVERYMKQALVHLCSAPLAPGD